MNYYIKTENNTKYYTDHIANIIVSINENKAEAKSFETEQEAQEFKDNCEYDLHDFEVVGE